MEPFVSTYPRIHLAIDNCFASKRWTTPVEWTREITELGVTCIEAGADTELDPLFLGRDYLSRWITDATAATERYGARIANLYSGHGTYATLGLAHGDHSIRRRFLDDWLAPMVETAAAVGAGLGFFCHAFPQSVLADPQRFKEEFCALATNLAEVARINRELGAVGPVGVEQMYSPHQVPWTVPQTRDLLRRVYAHNRDPFYVTIDVGHQSGQHRYRRPSRDAIETAVAAVAKTGRSPEVWMGPDAIVREVHEIAGMPSAARHGATDALLARLDHYPYLFSEPSDSDPYHWLRELAGWSPIIHLQQTDGTSSAHKPFNPETSQTGIVQAPAVLAAIRDHYDRVADVPDLPPRVRDIYLTIEVFAATAENAEQIRNKLRDSVEYWRRFIPRDGVTVDRIVDTTGG